MVRILCRGRLLAALAIAIGSIIAGWTPATAATLTVGKAAPNADPITPVNVGDKLGIFKKHGLDLTIVDFTGGSGFRTKQLRGQACVLLPELLEPGRLRTRRFCTSPRPTAWLTMQSAAN
jgi:ABC-type nitrate/sulfonate/bicarbonate transport system substrate-binding protein